MDRGLDILEFIATAKRPPSFSRLLADLGIPRSSLFHLLNNLQARGFIARDSATEGYGLGPKIVGLAKAAPQPSLSDDVLPFLRELSGEVHETCGFYIRVDDAVEVIGSAISTQALSYTMKVGARAPLYAVSAGKIVLAELEPEALKQYLARTVLTSVTPHTIRSKAQLRQEIQTIKATGFAYSHDEFTPGITAIAIAVREGGSFIGALNVAVPTARFTPDRDAEFREALRAMSQTMGRALT
ncbi:IclR family transcriptional regulator [Pseudorhodoplanes sinuspersici]|uniref:IclR family transcriptional regulator n=1 Tax=Pseudorhodoplanes sinuspersici TaxID=1235591 RepID=UPI0016026AD9|nr:IclR family transcriptional regulator [Pseudorhodoplanes sinuspersici]